MDRDSSHWHDCVGVFETHRMLFDHGGLTTAPPNPPQQMRYRADGLFVKIKCQRAKMDEWIRSQQLCSIFVYFLRW